MKLSVSYFSTERGDVKLSLKPTTRNIRDSGLTVKGWAKKHGYKYQTVVKVLNNFTGKRRIGITENILAELKKDGFLEEST